MNQYIILAQHAPDECSESWNDWLALHEAAPDLELVGGGAYCGCPSGDHTGILLAKSKEDAKTILQYEGRTGSARIIEAEFVPQQKNA